MFGDNSKEGWVPKNVFESEAVPSVMNGSDKQSAEFQKKYAAIIEKHKEIMLALNIERNKAMRYTVVLVKRQL